MFKILKTVSIFLLYTFFTFNLIAQDELKNKKLDQMIIKGIKDWQIPGLTTIVVKGDKVETQYGAGVVQEVRNNGSDLLVALKFGTIHLPTKSLINYGIGPAVPISLESAYQRAKAMYTGGQIKEALAVWMQGVKMLQSRKNPPCAALASYLAAASQAERSLGLTRKALNHASEALSYARKENTASTKTLVERLEKTVAMP